MTEAFPLNWPLGRERTPSYSRKQAPFKTTPGRARDELLHELKLLGAKDVVISTNVATYRRAGVDIPYADQSSAKADPGVAVYYTWRNEQYCLSCDKWNTVMDNMQACMKTVDALRGIERWGTGEMMKAAFAGFKSLPAPKTKPWWIVLNISQNATLDEIKTAYRTKSQWAHPDMGGSREVWDELQQAYTTALNSK